MVIPWPNHRHIWIKIKSSSIHAVGIPEFPHPMIVFPRRTVASRSCYAAFWRPICFLRPVVDMACHPSWLTRTMPLTCGSLRRFCRSIRVMQHVVETTWEKSDLKTKDKNSWYARYVHRGKNPRKNNFDFLKIGTNLTSPFHTCQKISTAPLLQDRAGRCALDVADVVTEAGFLGVKQWKKGRGGWE